MKHLVVGQGEVGKSLFNVLKKHFEVFAHDPKMGLLYENKDIDVLHICIPYTRNFVQITKKYQKTFSPKIMIIHSTVAIGTTEKIKGAVHSPIRGVHPNLEKGIKTFVKFFGGPKAKEASVLFEGIGIKTKISKNSRDSEAMKLWSTEQYRHFILLNKKIYKFCKDNGLNFDFVYTEANKTYNEGYTKLGMSNVVRPILRHVDGPIGGHCVEPNHKILGRKKKK